MTTATLTFTLPEDKGEFIMAHRGGDFYCSLREIQSIMRSHRKYDKKMAECWKEIEDVLTEAKLDEVE